MNQGDLTTLQAVKDWISITNANSDAALSGLITRISAAIRSHINRFDLTDHLYTEIRDGNDNTAMVLNNWPVNSLVSVGIGNANIRAGISDNEIRSAGYYLTPYDGNPPGNAQQVELLGYTYYIGTQNIKIIYRAGYVVTDEAFTVPGTPYLYTALQPKGGWSATTSVRYADTGVALVLVTGTPTAGHYAMSTTIRGGYQFAAADAGQDMLVTYSFTPFDLEQIAIEWISERNAYRTRIGVRSKTLAAQETISYDTSGVPNYVAAALMPYSNVMPIL